MDEVGLIRRWEFNEIITKRIHASLYSIYRMSSRQTLRRLYSPTVIRIVKLHPLIWVNKWTESVFKTGRVTKRETIIYREMSSILWSQDNCVEIMRAISQVGREGDHVLNRKNYFNRIYLVRYCTNISSPRRAAISTLSVTNNIDFYICKKYVFSHSQIWLQLSECTICFLIVIVFFTFW